MATIVGNMIISHTLLHDVCCIFSFLLKFPPLFPQHEFWARLPETDSTDGADDDVDGVDEMKLLK